MDLQSTIIPKSDQLNYDDLLIGPVVVEVVGVRAGNAEQPVQIDLAECRPFRPCKSMRRVLIAAWGLDEQKWIGRRMTLYGDPAIKYGGMAVGGIRISHLSDIPSRMQIALTVKRGSRAPYTVDPLPAPQQQRQTRQQAAQPATAGNGQPIDLAAVLGAPADLILGYLATRKEVALHVANLADLPPNAAKWLADNADTIKAAIAAWADGQAAE